MFCRRICFIGLFISVFGFVVSAQSKLSSEIKKWVVSENSTLRVNGNTNINKFSCDILAYDQTDTLIVDQNKSNSGVALTGEVNLSIRSFDCHNSMMTRDLRKTLKEKEFPLMRIKFLSLNKLPDLTQKPEPITGWVYIELAGAAKRFEVNYHIFEDAEKVIHLTGDRDINFTDFNLMPPMKLGGMIKTNDKLSVDFYLKIKVAE